MLREALRWSHTPRRGDRSGPPHNKRPARNGFGEDPSNYPPYLIGAPTKGFGLSAHEARCVERVPSRGGQSRRPQKHSVEPRLGKSWPHWTPQSPNSSPKLVWRGLLNLSTMSNGSTLLKRPGPDPQLACSRWRPHLLLTKRFSWFSAPGVSSLGWQKRAGLPATRTNR